MVDAARTTPSSSGERAWVAKIPWSGGRYTITQFTTVFSSEGIILDEPVSRTTYRDEFLPAIFVDRPARGAALLNAGRVTGLANVFEAQLRITMLDRDERVLVDRQVLATCGTGCWGRFDVTLEHDVPAAQWGTLRAWDPSERDGRPENVREYPAYLRPTP